MTEEQETSWYNDIVRPLVESIKPRKRQRSIWLNPQPNDPKAFPRIKMTGRIPRQDAPGLREEISYSLKDELDQFGRVVREGRIKAAQSRVKERRSTIDSLARAKGYRGTDNYPTSGRLLEDYAEAIAHLEIEEEVSRELHRLLKIAEEKEKSQELARRSGKKIGSVKSDRSGTPYLVDGYVVERKGDGFFIPALRVSLEQYLKECRASRKKQFTKTAGTPKPACSVCP